MPAPGPDLHKECRERIAELKRQLDVAISLEACSSCGGAGVVYEYGDYGAVYGSDDCDQCEAGRTIAAVDERLGKAQERIAELEKERDEMLITLARVNANCAKPTTVERADAMAAECAELLDRIDSDGILLRSAIQNASTRT